MTYGLEQRRIVNNGPAVTAVNARQSVALATYSAWRQLSAEHRLAAVERRLIRPTNFVDGYPLAL